jgi:hypothetical protein
MTTLVPDSSSFSYFGLKAKDALPKIYTLVYSYRKQDRFHMGIVLFHFVSNGQSAGKYLSRRILTIFSSDILATS